MMVVINFQNLQPMQVHIFFFFFFFKRLYVADFAQKSFLLKKEHNRLTYSFTSYRKGSNDKDPPWFNDEIRKTLTEKNEIFEQYITNGKSQTDYECLQLIKNSLAETIRSSKEKLYC